MELAVAALVHGAILIGVGFAVAERAETRPASPKLPEPFVGDRIPGVTAEAMLALR